MTAIVVMWCGFAVLVAAAYVRDANKDKREAQAEVRHLRAELERERRTGNVVRLSPRHPARRGLDKPGPA